MIAKRFRNIFFDLDGTLVDSVEGIQFSIEQALLQCGRSTQVDVRPYIGPPIRKIFTRLLGEDVPDMEQLVAAYRASYDTEGWKKTKLMGGARMVLEYLSEQQRFIVTNKPSKPTHQIVVHLDIGRFFSAVVSPDVFSPAAQSKAEMIERLLRSRGLRSQDSLFVGDTDEDYESARANNMECVILHPGVRRISKLTELIDD